MLKEFKEFATKGNIMDMAIGVIIGGAFQKIVTSLVNDMIMPTISIFTGKVDFSDLVLTIGNASIHYGSFITTIVDFLIIAFSIFIAIRSFNKLSNSTKEGAQKIASKTNLHKKARKNKKQKEAEVVTTPAPTSKVCPYCYSQIHIEATRCPHCTSIIDSKEENAESFVKIPCE